MSEYRPDEWRTVTLDEVPLLFDSIESVVEGWYLDEPIDPEDLLNRVEGDMLPDGKKAELPGQFDDPVCKALLAHARKVKREMTS